MREALFPAKDVSISHHHVPPLRLPIRDFGTDTFFFIGPGKRFWSRWCGTGGAGSTGGSPFRPPTKK
jgi:hypothetical protein